MTWLPTIAHTRLLDSEQAAPTIFTKLFAGRRFCVQPAPIPETSQNINDR